MFWVAVYLIVSYVLVGAIWGIIRAATRRRRKVYLSACILLFPLPLLPYAAISFQTALFGNKMHSEIRQALLNTGMSDGKIVMTRILFIGPKTARVFVEEPCADDSEWSGRTGTTIYLYRSAGHWKLSDWYTNWSDCGSAEGNTFPPYFGAKEF